MLDQTPPEIRLCPCGCGKPLSGKQTKLGFVWNKYYQNGCHVRGKRWAIEGRVIAARGYAFVFVEGDHPRANLPRKRWPEHVVVAESALGKLLPSGAEVHHWDETRTNNANSNLLICQDRGYHMLIHQRMAAFKASGNADFRHCQLCKTYGDPTTMRSYDKKGFTHWECWRTFMKDYYSRNREKWGISAKS